MSAEEDEEGDYYDRDTGRLMTYCVSCRCYRPVCYGYSDEITGAATIDLDGPVNLTKVTHGTVEKTYCEACGRRVYTDAELVQAKEQEETDKAKWTLAWIFILFSIGFVLFLALTAEG